MITPTTRALASLLACAALAACERREPAPGEPTPAPVRLEDVGRDAAAAARTTGRYVAQELAEWQVSAEASLARLEERGRDLADRARDSDEWREVERKRAAARARLEELRGSSGDRARTLREQADEALADLERALEKTSVRFGRGTEPPSPASAPAGPVSVLTIERTQGTDRPR